MNNDAYERLAAMETLREVTNNLAQPLLDECRKRGWEIIILVANRPDQHHAVGIQREPSNFNPVQYLSRIVQIPQKRFLRLLRETFDIHPSEGFGEDHLYEYTHGKEEEIQPPLPPVL